MAKTKTASIHEKPAASRLWSVMLYALLGLLLFGTMYGRNLSGDVWWHLKTGQYIVEQRAFPFVDPFSYTARAPVILHEWGAEVIQWFIYKASPPALAAVSVLLISLAFIITFKMALARSRRVLSSFMVVAAGACASMAGAEMRPQVFSFVLFALTLVILQRYHERGGRVIWLLPPLMFLWVNLHAIFLIGVALIVIESVVAFLKPPDWARDANPSRWAAAKPLAIVAAVSIVAGLINPNGIASYLYPLKVLGNSEAVRLTVEWNGPNFREWTGRALMVLLGMTALGLAVRKEKPALRDFAYVAVFGAASLMSQRHAVLFAIGCAAPIALWFSAVEDEARSWLSEKGLDVAAERALWTVLAVFIVVLFSWRVSDAKGWNAFDYMNTSEVFPSKVCDFLLSSDLQGPMFNDYNYGGYLIWRLWPKHRVFVDSRQEPFLGGTFEETEYATKCAGPRVWENIFNKYEINFAVLHPAQALSSVLAERKDWGIVYEDDKAVVFVRKGNLTPR